MTHQSFDAGVVYCYDAKELMGNRKKTKSAMSDLRPASLVVSKESARVEFDKTRQRPSDTLSSQFAFPWKTLHDKEAEARGKKASAEKN